jgi:hypothetical protein
VKYVLFIDQAGILRGDVAVFRKLDLEGAVAAAPVISLSKDKGHYWNQYDYQAARFKRPFHSTAMVYIDVEKWRQTKAGDAYRHLYSAWRNYQLSYGQIDDDLFNLLQLNIQFVTLPENTAFCPKQSDRSLAEKAFSIMICDSDAVEILGKEYQELQHLASTKY